MFWMGIKRTDSKDCRATRVVRREAAVESLHRHRQVRYGFVPELAEDPPIHTTTTEKENISSGTALGMEHDKGLKIIHRVNYDFICSKLTGLELFATSHDLKPYFLRLITKSVTQ
jgi:hypothetical protein